MTDRIRLVFWPTLAAAVVLAILIALGTWQWNRLIWKEALIARVAERTAAAPAALPPETVWPAVDPEVNDYTPATATGTFRHDREIHVFHVLGKAKGPLGGQGYFVMTPLVRGDGTIVIVNRGFVPLDRKDPATRAEGQVQGLVTVSGLLRRPEAGNLFTPVNNTAANVWFTRDAREIARAADLDPARTFPLTLDAAAAATPPGGLPQAGESLVTFTNNHLQYVITWYGLALTLVGVWIAFVRGRWQHVGL